MGSGRNENRGRGKGKGSISVRGRGMELARSRDNGRGSFSVRGRGVELARGRGKDRGNNLSSIDASGSGITRGTKNDKDETSSDSSEAELDKMDIAKDSDGLSSLDSEASIYLSSDDDGDNEPDQRDHLHGFYNNPFTYNG
ncbi:uncharacterized protein LOC110602056 [Manihot esculenta]|uniref:uncharacterized protein LOC110602056 n=1 Tax=Manihot esculenta TaxID=3983 RepID=UPI000B5D1955|nr:uncharacterized protein LOC110602056 [Manihot esculenta]